MDNRRTKRTLQKCFRYVSEDHIIAKCPKPPKENKKRRKKVRFSEIGYFALQKEYDNGDNNNDQYIYAYMACMPDNEKS